MHTITKERVVLMKALLLLLSLLPFSLSFAGEFQPGAYTATGANGVKTWQLNFTPKNNATGDCNVTGSFGGILSSQVTGLYVRSTNTLIAEALRPDQDQPRAEPLELEGNWDPRRDEFVVRIKNQGIPTVLKFDASNPDPGLPRVTFGALALDPLVAGAQLKGRCPVTVSNIKSPTSIVVRTLLKDPDQNLIGSASITIDFDQAGTKSADLSEALLTVPARGQSVIVELRASAHPQVPMTSVSATAPVGGRTREVYIDEVDFDMGEDSQGFLFKVWHTAVELGLVQAKAFITVTLTPKSGSGVIKISPVEAWLDVSTPWTRCLVRAPKVPAGEYRLTARIEGEKVAPYTVATNLWLGETPSRKQEPPPAKPTGQVTVAKSVIEPGEKTRATVRITIPSGPSDTVANLEVELINPGGQIEKALKKTLHLKPGTPVDSGYDLEINDPGVFKIKARLSGTGIETWSGEASLEVKQPVTTGSSGATSPPTGDRSLGYFGLVKKVVGKSASPETGPYGSVSGSITESSYSYTWTAKAPANGSNQVDLRWSTPPAILKPGEVIELTVTASSSIAGPDRGNIGSSGSWYVNGRASVIEGRGAFAGVAGDGKHYASNSSTFKIQIESGSPGSVITLSSGHSGMMWGSDGVWNPCVYTYEWLKDPTAQPGDTGPAGGERNENEDKPNVFAATDPSDDDFGAIEAWLDKTKIKLFAGETGEIVDISIRGFRGRTLDRVEVIFPDKIDDWASLPNGIVVMGGNGSYDPANMGRPVHTDGYFFRARDNAPGGTFMVEIIVRQNKAGFVRLFLEVEIVPRLIRVPDPASPTPPAAPPRVFQPGTKGGGRGTGPNRTFGGFWNTNLGRVSLAQQGTTVTGEFPGGTITGRVTGDLFEFTMTEPISGAIGSGRWRISSDERSVDGGWSPGPAPSDPMSTWRGTRDMGGVTPTRVLPQGGTRPGSETSTTATAPTGAVGGVDLSPGRLAGTPFTRASTGQGSATVMGDRLVLSAASGGEDNQAESFLNTPMKGDFDLVLDYTLENWDPGRSGVINLFFFFSDQPTMGDELLQIVRQVSEDGDIVNAQSGSSMLPTVPAQGTAGQFRIQRKGSRWTISHKDTGAWTELGTVTFAVANAYLGFQLHTQEDAKAAKVSVRPMAGQ